MKEKQVKPKVKHESRQHRPKPAENESSSEHAVQTNPSETPISHSMGSMDLSLDSQRRMLAANPIQSAQRQDLATQIGSLQGNSFLQRVIAPTHASQTSFIQRQEAKPPPTPGTEGAEKEAKPEPLYDIQIGSDKLTQVDKKQVLRFLWMHYERIKGWVEAGESAHERLKKIREEQWFVGAIADSLGDPMALIDPTRVKKIPPLEIWKIPLTALEVAREKLAAEDVKAAEAKLIQSEEFYNRCHKMFYEYRMGTIAGAERGLTTLKVTAVAGGIAATVATGGMAAKAGLLYMGLAAGGGAGWYGVTSEAAKQTGEAIIGERVETDFLAMVKRGATDFVTGFIGAITGGALGRVFMRAFGPYLANIGDDVLAELGKQMNLAGPLPRDYLLTAGQRYLADFLAGIGTTPLTTATQVVMNRLIGGGKGPTTAGEFIDLVVDEMVKGGIIQLFLGGFLHAHAARTQAGRPVSPAEEAITQPISIGEAPTLPLPTGKAPTLPAGGEVTQPMPPFELAPTIKAPIPAARPGLPTTEAPIPLEGGRLPTTLPPLSPEGARLPTTLPPLPPESGRLPTTEPPFPLEAVPHQSASAARAAATAVVTRPHLARRVDSVTEARALRDQWVREGRPILEKFSPASMKEDWNLVLGQGGEPPPAYIDTLGNLIWDANRVGAIPESVLSARRAPVNRVPDRTPAGPRRVVQRIDSVTEARRMRDLYGSQGRLYYERFKPEFFKEDYYIGGGTGEAPPAYIDDLGVLWYDARRVGTMPEHLLGNRPAGGT